MQQRRILSEAEKKAYEKKIKSRSVPAGGRGTGAKLKAVVAGALAMLVLLAVVFFAFVRPMTISRLVGEFNRAEFSNGENFSVEELKGFAIEREYSSFVTSGSGTRCELYMDSDGGSEKVATLEFAEVDGEVPCFFYEGKLYSCTADPLAFEICVLGKEF